MKRRATEITVSKMGSPNETTGIATAIIVEDFCEPASESKLSRKPRNKLPLSPKNMVAGLKL